MRPRRLLLFGLLVAAAACGGATLAAGTGSASAPAAPIVQQATAAPSAPAIALPNKDGSLKFAVLGDFGTGDRPQYQVGEQMAKVRDRFPYEMVITVGDNIYGADRPQDMRRKFEEPYKTLIAAGVKFYASLGNHDDRAQARYKLFSMDGRTYYTFKAPQQDVRFFALESDYPTPQQIAWVSKELANSGEKWKIPYFHHPLYSSGKTHGSHPELRDVLEPLFVTNGVTVVFTGHDHFYERIKPQRGITHFVTGSGGKLRKGNIDRRSPLTAFGYDVDQAFLVVEIDGDQLFFNAIARTGAIIDSGVIERRKEE
jgi:calcineurin-like phosphoesterase family protein